MIVGKMAGRGYSYSKSTISGTWADGEGRANVNLAFSGPPTAGFPSTLTTGTSGSYAAWCPAFATDELIAFQTDGGQILLCDGSVQFITQETDASIILSLASRDGGETIEEGSIGD